MDRKELSDIILRNVSGAKSALNTHADYEKYDKKDMERHRSYLDALKGYFNIYNENILQENCLKGVQDYLISQYSFIPTNVMPEIDTGKITKTKVGTAIYYGQFLLIAAPFTMISPFNYVLGGFGMAFLIANKLAKRIAKAPSKISKRDKTQAKQLHKEYQYMRDDLRDTSLSVFDEILQANKDIIVPMLRAQ